jgi:hypothetical protein
MIYKDDSKLEYFNMICSKPKRTMPVTKAGAVALGAFFAGLILGYGWAWAALG